LLAAALTLILCLPATVRAADATPATARTDSLAARAPADSIAPAPAPQPPSQAARTKPDRRSRNRIRDVQGVGRAGGDVRTDSTRRSFGNQPRIVMARSLLVPGWGQVHNHAWFKAALVAGAEGWMIARILDDQHVLNGLLRDLDAAQRDSDAVRAN